MFTGVLKKFRDCVSNRKVVVTQHAFDETQDDDILQIDVEHCILTGEIVERQWDKEWHEWKYIVVGETTDGDDVGVVLKHGRGGNAVIITAYLI
jgi:hypothetical protein